MCRCCAMPAIRSRSSGARLIQAIKISVDGERARIAAGLDQIHRLPAKHFLQEDQASELADVIAKLVRS
jgi:hypothetical protein